MREKRRYPRAQVNKTLAGLMQDFSAVVTWPNLETSEVVDISYKGMAVGKPGLFPLGVQQRVEVEISLGHLPKFAVTARIAWVKTDWIGLEFYALPAEGHAAMTEYLDAKLTGNALKPVESEFVSSAENFQYWYQGPGQTHVYIWMSATQIERVRVDMDGSLTEFTRGQTQLQLRPAERRALLVLSQMDKEGLPMEDFVRTLIIGS